ncbi:uncharacterized protein LOC111703033 isoform X2 [Eurytemora carolleeae]|uniref:uncharacterized protein LOC111703033 isoform X2 n=1 Tax=Eurytemora carolleeae TaxID=1294199 RepID=UPI000C76344A|nr:uncharacterized protein LOC111703033 isoform X2 [Eurytemora carolleeae]|eukprot:XP_023330648.1 uncharacterized protein LOC111703033 isoform X2 [Eurytemora affinis]
MLQRQVVIWQDVTEPARFTTINTYQLIDCNEAHYPKYIKQVNERRYEFGDEKAAREGTAWVCSKVPNNGKVKKDCIPKVRAPGWYEHLLLDPDYKGCNGGVCYCDDKDGCNTAPGSRSLTFGVIITVIILLIFS